MKFSLQSRQVNCSDLLRLVSQHEAGSLALETVIIEVRAWQVQGRVEQRVGSDRGLQHCKCIESPPCWVLQFPPTRVDKWRPLSPVPLSSAGDPLSSICNGARFCVAFGVNRAEVKGVWRE